MTRVNCSSIRCVSRAVAALIAVACILPAAAQDMLRGPSDVGSRDRALGEGGRGNRGMGAGLGIGIGIGILQGLTMPPSAPPARQNTPSKDTSASHKTESKTTKRAAKKDDKTPPPAPKQQQTTDKPSPTSSTPQTQTTGVPPQRTDNPPNANNPQQPVTPPATTNQPVAPPPAQSGDDAKSVKPQNTTDQKDESGKNSDAGTPPSLDDDKDPSTPTVTTRVDEVTGVITTTEEMPASGLKGTTLIKKTIIDPHNGTTTIIDQFRFGTTTLVTNADGTSTLTKVDKLDGSTTVISYDKDKHKNSTKKTRKDGSAVTRIFGDLKYGGGMEVWINTDAAGKVISVGSYGSDSGDLEEHGTEAQEVELHFVDQQSGNKIEVTIDVPSGVRITMTRDAKGDFVSEETYDPATGQTTVVTEGRM
jgi:hypothetical protein